MKIETSEGVIGPSLAAAVLNLDRLMSCSNWAKFATVGRYNAMRHLRARGWIIDENEAPRRRAREAGPDWVPSEFPCRWVLTKRGREIATELKK